MPVDVSRPNLTLEAQLLLCCAHTEMGPAHREQLNILLQQDVDWVYLIQLAIMHGVMPLLYSNLKRFYPDALPEETMARLKARFMANARQNVSQTGELLQILKIFKANNIPAIPFKGPAQAAAVYGNLTFRQFGDLDILVHKQDVWQARALLADRGYRFYTQLTAAQEIAYLHSRNHHHFCLVRDDGKATVEIHWEVAPRHFAPAIEVEQLWQRAESIPLAGETVAAFAPQDFVLLLCMHNSKHGWNRLEYICAVAEFLQTDHSINWDQVLIRAKQWRCLHMLLLGLHLAQVVLDASLPDTIQNEIDKSPAIRPLAGQTRSRLFEENNAAPGVFASVAYRMRVQDRWIDRIRYGSSIIFSPTLIEWQNLPLPGFLSFLYPLLRPLRLAAKYSLRLLNPLFGKLNRAEKNEIIHIDHPA